MTRRWIGRMVGLLGGFVTGLALAMWKGASLLGMSGYERWWNWVLRGGDEYTLFTFPIGAALAGILGAAGLMRWRSILSTIGIIVASALIGAIISVAASFFLVCAIWGYANMGCSGFFKLRFFVELPAMWFILATMTVILGLAARWLANSESRLSDANRPGIPGR